MNNKLNNMIQRFLSNTDAKDEDELNEKLQEFLEKYNNGEVEYENTELDDAYELLEKAENARSKKQAIKYAKEAYELCPACFESILFQQNLEENSLKRDELLDEGLKIEKERLEKEGFFSKKNIGQFYSIFETCPYIRGLYTKVCNLVNAGKLTQARDLCKEILRLNELDNIGSRYMLMAIYAMLEDEQETLKLSRKYPENNLEMLFPLFALYYKLGKEEKAISYLHRINEQNPYFLKFFNHTIKEKELEEASRGYYSHGDVSEIVMYVTNYNFLLFSMRDIEEFVLEHSKKVKKGKK